MSFKLLKTSKKSKARLGKLKTTHGIIDTPFFLPIATTGAVKALDVDDLRNLQAQILLGNTYHLFLQPGINVIKKAGGLHKFMNWQKPILTDSGGFQVFSLARIRKITRRGVEFNSHIDGKKHFISPEKSIKIQLTLGSDIIMSFDECPPYPSKKEYCKSSMELTTKWAITGKRVFDKTKSPHSKLSSGGKIQLFGIIQGGIYKDLRIKHTKELVDIGFDGYALGGLAVGEPVKKMYEAIDWCEPYLPKDKPRYLMGTGYPGQLVEAVKRGMDMFDCVIPTREARHGRLYLWRPQARNPKSLRRQSYGASATEILNKSQKSKSQTNKKANEANKLKAKSYKVINITNRRFKADFSPIDETGRNKALGGYGKAYLRHLFRAKEPLGIRLATLNNLYFYLELMRAIRKSIKDGSL